MSYLDKTTEELQRSFHDISLIEKLNELSLSALSEIYDVISAPKNNIHGTYGIWIENIHNDKFFAIVGDTFEHEDEIKNIIGAFWDHNGSYWRVPHNQYYKASLIVSKSKKFDALPEENKQNRSRWFIQISKSVYFGILSGLKIREILNNKRKYATMEILDIYPSLMAEFSDNDDEYHAVQFLSIISDVIFPRKAQAIDNDGLYEYKISRTNGNVYYWVEGYPDKVLLWILYHGEYNNYKLIDNGTKLYYEINN